MSIRYRIHEAGQAEIEARSSELAELLIDTVSSGASVGFLTPPSIDDAIRYWIEVGECQTRITLVAESGHRIVGSVQLDLCARPNAIHRAEILNLLVHRGARRQGIGRALLAAAEESAREQGRTLLVLDTRRGDSSEALYRSLGYHEAGVIPRYARASTGELHDTVLFYKELSETRASSSRVGRSQDDPLIKRRLDSLA
jgi:ribosomal protein S18 acetylase RimI-like enzyme